MYDDDRAAVMKFNDVLYKLEKLFEEYAPPERNIPDASTTASASKSTTNKSITTKWSKRKRKFEFIVSF